MIAYFFSFFFIEKKFCMKESTSHIANYVLKSIMIAKNMKELKTLHNNTMNVRVTTRERIHENMLSLLSISSELSAKCLISMHTLEISGENPS